MIWLLSALAAFFAIGGTVVSASQVIVALSWRSTWSQTYKAACWAGVFGSTAVMAAIVLVRMWTA